jgi:hypothetical protein
MTETQRRCGEHAAFRYTWPGKDEAHICIDCATRLMTVANAIGLHLQLIPLAYSVSAPMPTEFPTCEQMRAKEPS